MLVLQLNYLLKTVLSSRGSSRRICRATGGGGAMKKSLRRLLPSATGAQMKRCCIPASALPHNTVIMVLSLLTQAPPAPGRVYGASSLMPGLACLLSSERRDSSPCCSHEGNAGSQASHVRDSMPLTVSSAGVEVQVHERRTAPPPP